MSDTAIIIVTFNSAALVGACLDSCLRLAPEAEILVVDNASEDGTLREAQGRPGVRWICNTENKGFGAAVNQGVSSTRAPFLLILNPDATLKTPIGALEEECRNGAGAVGGLLLDYGGRPQRGFTLRRLPSAASLAFEALGINRLWPNNPINRRYRCLDCSLDEPCAAEQPPGAFLMFRRDAWEAVGGFDEGFYPLWFEDVDFCKRLASQRILIRFTPLAVALHAGGHSVKNLAWPLRSRYWYGSLLRYAGKHFRPAERRLVCLCVCAGVALRLLGEIGNSGWMPAAGAALSVIRLAAQYFFSVHHV
jgi:hypothetical protein